MRPFNRNCYSTLEHMPLPSFVSKIASIFSGAGLGILAVSFLISSILFGFYSTSFNSYDEWTLLKNPYQHESVLRVLAIVITVFSALGSVICLVSLILSSIFSKFLFQIIIVICVTLFGLGTLIGEGLFYSEEVESLKGKTGYNYNNTQVQTFIKESLEELYSTAYDFLYKANLNSSNITSMPTFSTFSNTYLGKPLKQNPLHIIQYADLLDVSNKNDFITFIIDKQKIQAIYQNFTNISIASLQFKTSGNISMTKQACWTNDKKTELTCGTKKLQHFSY